MSAGGAASRDVAGSALVTLQLALIAALGAWGVPAFARGDAPAAAWALVAIGVLLGLWALSANRPGNFNIRPTPRVGGHLVQEGPYHWIRHPMYSAVLLAAAACCWAATTVWTLAAWAALAAVLALKATLEERRMAAAHPQYQAYCARTRRFVPGLL